MQRAKGKGKGAQDSAATEEAALGLGEGYGSWPALRAIRLGSAVLRRNRGYFAATGCTSLMALLGFVMIPRGLPPGPELTAVALAGLAGLGHALAIERTQRDLLGEPERTSAEAALQWCLRLPALLGVVLLVTAVICLLDIALSPLVKDSGILMALLVGDLLVRFTGFPLHEVVAGERNPLLAVARSTVLSGFPLRAFAAQCTQWMILGAAGWGLAVALGLLGGFGLQVIFSSGLSYSARSLLQGLGASILIPVWALSALFWISWLQTSWAAYYLLRKEEQR